MGRVNYIARKQLPLKLAYLSSLKKQLSPITSSILKFETKIA